MSKEFKKNSELVSAYYLNDISVIAYTAYLRTYVFGLEIPKDLSRFIERHAFGPLYDNRNHKNRI